MVAALFAMFSCSKDCISPEELFKDGSKVAKITIHTRSDYYDDTETTFSSPVVYRKSDVEGQSWFSAFSNKGRMVHELFMLSIYFDSIDRMRVGNTLKTSRFVFSFLASSDSNATSYTYGGKITLADRGDDYVILRFHEVSVSCSLGSYVIDGYLYCPLNDEFVVSE